jgi:hypothetical protein
MKCAGCGCYDERLTGWVALLGTDPDDADAPDEVIAFCPVCASREFKIARKTAEGYV